ncbi:MAG: gamma-glutamylcyclotransferase [Thermoleophilaceae bacterium]
MRYFAYGSNMAASQMNAWCEGYRCIGPRVAARPRAGVPAPLGALGGRRRGHSPAQRGRGGGVLYDLPEAALAALDEKEFEGIGYRRIEVEVEHGDEVVTAWAYEVIDRAPAELRPRPEYLGLMLSAGREHELPEEYLAELGARW